jgi:AcrR family transcriptional regulator
MALPSLSGTALSKASDRSTCWLRRDLLVKNERSFYIGHVPRVSEAHLAARRQQILDAARRRFLRNGFHSTSMQDVIAEAGLSMGAVYRYFRSKNEIIAAIASSYATELRAVIGELATDPALGLDEVMERVVGLVDENTGPDGILRLAVQVWAEALRDPAVGAVAEEIYAAMRGNFVELAERAVDAGELPADADPKAVGAALFSLVLGYALQRMLTGEPDLSTYRAGLRSLLTA